MIPQRRERAIGTSENPGGGEGRTSSNEVGVICPLILITLVYLPKSGGGAIVPPNPTVPTALVMTAQSAYNEILYRTH